MTIETALKGNLHEFKGAVKQTWGKLTSNEIDEIKGKTERLIGALMKKYEISQELAEREVIKYMQRHKAETEVH